MSETSRSDEVEQISISRVHKFPGFPDSSPHVRKIQTCDIKWVSKWVSGRRDMTGIMCLSRDGKIVTSSWEPVGFLLLASCWITFKTEWEKGMFWVPLKYFVYFYVYVWYLHVCLYTAWVENRREWTWTIHTCEQPRGCWEPNLGPSARAASAVHCWASSPAPYFEVLMFHDIKPRKVSLAVFHASFLSGNFLVFVTQDVKDTGVCFTMALISKTSHLSHKSSCCLLVGLNLRTRCLVQGTLWSRRLFCAS